MFLSIETGALAKQAAGCCTVQYGETVTLSAAASGPPRPGIDYFPLTCDYRERHAAAGKFPGGFLKREGRPTTKETLTSRLIDRPIRPMFADRLQRRSADPELRAVERSADGRRRAGDERRRARRSAFRRCRSRARSARCGSGMVDGEFVPFPTHDELEDQRARPDRLRHARRGADDRRLRPRDARRPDARGAARRPIGIVRELCDLQQELIDKVGAKKMDFVPPPNDGLYDRLRERLLRSAEGRPSRPKASRPAPTRSAQVKAQALAEIDSRSRRPRARRRSSAFKRRGTTWKSASSAT